MEWFSRKRKDVMGLPVSKKQQKSVQKYVKDHYDSILVHFPKGTKEIIKENSKGESINGFIVSAVSEKIVRDNK